MDSPSQDSDRRIREVEYELLVTPGGRAHAGEALAWVVRHVWLSEEVSVPYRLEVEGRCDVLELEVPMLVGADASFRMVRDDDRFVHGVVRDARYLSTTDGELVVAFEIVPALQMLEGTRRSRIFQDLGPLDILQQVVAEVFGERGRRLDTSLLDPSRYPVRDYCAQFRETDLRLFERLCAEEGISFVFDHEGDAETVVLVDDNAGFCPIGARSWDRKARTHRRFRSRRGPRTSVRTRRSWGSRGCVRECDGVERGDVAVSPRFARASDRGCGSARQRDARCL